MRNCPKCNRVIENDAAKFCKYCGSRLPIGVTSQSTANLTTDPPTPKPTEQPVATLIVPPVPKATEIVNDGGIPLERNESPISQNGMPPIPTRDNNNSQCTLLHPPHKKKWTMGQAISQCFKKYTVCKGRACRSEYWYFVLFYYICVLLPFLVGFILDEYANKTEIACVCALLSYVCMLVFVFPLFSASVRRLHDVKLNGWFYLINLIPLLGSLIFIIVMCRKGKEETNKYGYPV